VAPLFVKAFQAWTRLYERFDLEPSPVEDEGLQPILLSTIQPITDSDELLKVLLVDSTNKNLEASAGTFTAYFTVPTDKRWEVQNITREATTGGTPVKISDGTKEISIFPFGTGAEARNGLWEMQAGWEIGLNTTGNGADTAIELGILFKEQDAF